MLQLLKLHHVLLRVVREIEMAVPSRNIIRFGGEMASYNVRAHILMC